LGALLPLGAGSDLGGGWPGEAGVWLLIVSSLSHPAQNETKRQIRPCGGGGLAVLALVSAV
jgi:osmoprotectant transport system substrate-binding protein